MAFNSNPALDIAIKNSGKTNPGKVPVYIKHLKIGIWLYFLLLIFEGAIRKWILPGLSSPLLVIRDPIAIFLIVTSIRKGIFPSNGYLFTICLIGFFSIITALLFGHGNLFVTAYGARILLLHFPVIFIIGKIFTREDVVKVGIATLWITIPMTILMALQFYSPQSAFVNRGVGGEEVAGFTGALGFFRPSGTFSFTNGSTLYYGFVAAFVAFFSIDRNGVKPYLLVAASMALIAAIPLSISRTLLFLVLLSLVFLIIAVSRKPKYLARLLVGLVGIIMVLFILNQASFFKTGTSAFTSRFEIANKQEGGLKTILVDRFLGGMVGAIISKKHLPFFGGGVGLGTNVGAMLTAGERQFLISEGEWGRLIGELGLLFGLSIIFTRIVLVIDFTKQAYRKLVKGDLLPWMLLSYGFIAISQGLWAQPTALGFSTIIGGLIAASLKK